MPRSSSVTRPARTPAPRRLIARAEAWTTHIATLLVGGTGLVYAWMAYLLEPADPFALVNHPWQPHVQHLHVLAAPLLVFAAGLLWRRHVWASWKLGIRERRRSGVGLALAVMPMIVSGYLIQTAVGETWRKLWLAVHLAASALWILGYLAHQLGRRPMAPSSSVPREQEGGGSSPVGEAGRGHGIHTWGKGRRRQERQSKELEPR